MNELTRRQRAVLRFIEARREAEGGPPTLREIAAHFGFRSLTAARDHVGALCRKGVLERRPGRARALRVPSPPGGRRAPIADIPLYGAIPAGFADGREQEPEGCLSVDVATLGIQPTARTFALRVRGDSMTGRHILDGDYVVCEHGLPPRPGDVVAALIDNESTLKTLVRERNRIFLRAENPKYPRLIPAGELVIQGVVVAVVRRCR